MKIACGRCWDRNCNCTKEELLEHSIKNLDIRISKLQEKIENLNLGGYKVLEDVTVEDCSTFYLDGFVFKTGERLETYQSNPVISIFCVAYPNRFKLLTDSCNPVTIKKGTRFYKIISFCSE
jgi:hypothetical protein